MLDQLATERRNEQTMQLDEMTVEDVLRVMNAEDQTVATVIREQIPVIAEVVKHVIASFKTEDA